MDSQTHHTADQRVIRRITSMLSVDERLKEHAAEVQISIEGAVIVLRGSLPTPDLKQALVPVVRLAGVLGQVSNCVCVPG